MKTWILATAMMIGITVCAQEGREKHEPLKPEQRAELHVKQLALELDLNQKQQQDLKKLFIEKGNKMQEAKEKRKANKEDAKKLTADERFTMKSKMLDEQIAMKEEMKKILTPAQFEKWEGMKKEKHQKITNRSKKFKKQHKR